ncbi:putative ribonuclease H-like domain-containing protein [Tanacetum coccineum]
MLPWLLIPIEGLRKPRSGGLGESNHMKAIFVRESREMEDGLVILVNSQQKHFAEERAKAKRNKPMTQSQLRSYMSNYLKNQGTWKLSQLKKLKFKEIKEEFEKLVKQIDTFVPINIKATKAQLKRYGEELQIEISKKQRIDDKDVSDIKEKVGKVKEEEPVKRVGKRKNQKARKGISIDKSPQGDSKTDKEESVEAMNPIPLDTKSNIVANWKIFQQGKRSIFKIIRANRAYTVYMSFGAMLKDFTREDLIELYRFLFGAYHTAKVDLGWRYSDKCAYISLTLEACNIYMLADRKYPLSKDACQVMLKMKLLDGKMNEVCYKLLKMIEKQAGLATPEQTATGKEYSNPLIADDLLKIIWRNLKRFALKDDSWVKAMQEELLQFRNKRDERGVVVRNKARLVAQGHRQEEGIDYDEVFAPVSAFVSQPPVFVDLHGNIRRGTIDKTLFIKKDKKDIMLVQVYVDDIIFGSTRKSWCDEFEELMKGRFQMSSMGELGFFLGLQVKQKTDGILISQDKYVADMLKKFGLASVKTAITLMETKMALTKDEEADEVDVHLYRSMIGSLIYLTASRPYIMFVVCACSRFQVTPKTLHLNAVKRSLKYLKGKPNLGLWYPRESSFYLEAYSNSDFAGANLDRNSTTGGCQFLRSRLISWQCKNKHSGLLLPRKLNM